MKIIHQFSNSHYREFSESRFEEFMALEDKSLYSGECWPDNKAGRASGLGAGSFLLSSPDPSGLLTFLSMKKVS